MTSPIALSFLVPTYNAGPYLVTAIESILDQLVPGDEVLVQDGASTDGSVEALLAHFSGADWLKVVSAPDDGQSDALQKALDRATNDYVIWLNADDIVYPDALAAVRAALADGPDLVIGRSTIFTNDGRIVRTYTPRPLTREAMVGRGADLFTGSMVFRTQLVRDAGGFNARFQYCMDMDMIVRAAEQNPTIAYIPVVIGGLRWHAESKGGSTLWPIVREATEVRLAHARTTGEKVGAIGASTAYLLVGLLQPVRHSRSYSKVRARLAGRALPVGTDAP
jgi:glycosyltransferase involved in cell wall biosynthesis